MFRVLRSLPAAMAVASLLVLSGAAPARADLEEIDPNGVPVIFDLVILRPLGLATTALGVAAFVPAAALTALVRPTDIGKPFEVLVKQPFGYTFMDPLGTH
jgi:hypothetical protein